MKPYFVVAALCCSGIFCTGMKRIFDELGYRRYEWKCDSLNERSCQSAKRLGFTFEGIFRQHNIVKGHNRDTAWFSIIDKEWNIIKNNYLTWLDEKNFNEAGYQIESLTSLMQSTKKFLLKD